MNERGGVVRRLVVVVVLVGLAGGASWWWTSGRAETGRPVGATASALCDPLHEEETGRVGGDLTEISGLVASRSQPDVLWVHEDSGAEPRVVAIDRRGAPLATFTVAGARADDWEDVARGPGPAGEADRLYLADIGDNAEQRESVSVYRVAEPEVSEATPRTGAATEPADRLELRYPDGPHDAETLLVDPRSSDLLVVTKSLLGRSGVYRADAAAPGPQRLERVGSLDLGLGGTATGGDVSPTGGAVVVRTYLSVFVWGVGEGESLARAMARPPCRGPRVAERQGEALGFDRAGTGLWTTAEGASPPLHHFTAGTP